MASAQRSNVPVVPRGPVLDWSILTGARDAKLPSIDQQPNSLLVTSGRAALALALRALNLPSGSKVLVPTYHCPTMVAPVVYAGLQPVFYAMGADALPLLPKLSPGGAEGARAIIVAHCFGLPRSLAAVRQWCDTHDVALIEDCAHSFFGQAGERPVGAWGDYATASLTKFFPVPEAGLLVSASRHLPTAALIPQGWMAQFKGAVDVLETASSAGRLGGLRLALGGLFALKNHRRGKRVTGRDCEPIRVADITNALQGCDMSRTGQSPLTMARWTYALLPRARIAARRLTNFRRLKNALADAPGTHVLLDDAPTDAPYALPLWVEDADRVYAGLRVAGLPVFRWDRIWEGTPLLENDEGPSFSRHVLQLLCHQDMSDAEIERMVATTRSLL